MVSGRKKAQPSNDLRAKWREALEAAVAYFGSQAKLAEATGVKQPSIFGALSRGRASEDLARRIHRASKGKCPRWGLRPDLFERGEK